MISCHVLSRVFMSCPQITRGSPKLNVFLSYIFHRRRTVFSDALPACFLERIGKFEIGICLAQLELVHRLIHEKDPKSQIIGKIWRGAKMNKSAAALRMAVELRNHPRMSYRKVPSWPPSWVWISGSEDKQPKGEVGILKQVRMVNGHPIVHRCFLWMEYEDGTYLGCLLL